VSTPATPTLKWKRGAAELVNIGQTWSEPKVVKVAGYTTNPVIIMGGGYDLCEDADVVPNTTCGTPEGNRIFVLDANTGTLLKTFTTDRSVVADITAVDNDGDGKVDMVYAVDTGANIYRIDIGMAAPGSWTMSKIAALGGATAASDRKFLHAPEVVTGAGFNAVLVGSGNRERPLLANQAVNVDNAFFMIKDDRSASPSVITTSSLVAIDPDAVLTTTQKADLALSTNKGWYLALGSGGHDKEQVVTSAVVLAGIAYFSTHTPTVPTACDNLGLARGYAVSYLDASASSGGSRFSTIIGGGLPPSPVAGIVTVTLTVTNSDGTTTTKKNPDGTDVTVDVPFVITDTTTVVDPKVNPSAVRSRVYWYIKQ
jgi:type IV pilus assembly protein PilY1